MFAYKSRLLVGFIAVFFAASSYAQVVRVGSKNFTEQFIVAEIYAQALQSAGIEARTRTNLGATLIAHAALLNGEIDLYPEYTGTAMAHVVKGDLSGSADQTYQTVKSHYEKNLHLTLLAPAHVDNGYAIIVLPETAARYHLRTLSDLGPASKDLSFGAEGSFADRTDGLPGMSRVYGIHFKEFRNLAKLGIRYSALTGKSIDVSFGFTTDWQIAQDRLVVLEDDKHLFPPYFLVRVIREDTLARNPRIAEVLNKVDSLLNNENMRARNAAVERDKEEPKDVAAGFLKKQGHRPKLYREDSGRRPAHRAAGDVLRRPAEQRREDAGAPAKGRSLSGARRTLAFSVINGLGALRALPSLAILAIMMPLLGIGLWPSIVALTVLALPPILLNAYVGLRDVDPDAVEAAVGMGMNRGQVLRRIRIGLAAPAMFAGARTASGYRCWQAPASLPSSAAAASATSS